MTFLKFICINMTYWYQLWISLSFWLWSFLWRCSIIDNFLWNKNHRHEREDQPEWVGQPVAKNRTRCEVFSFLGAPIMVVPDEYHGFPEYTGTCNHSNSSCPQADSYTPWQTENNCENQAYSFYNVKPRLNDHKWVFEVSVKRIVDDVVVVGEVILIKVSSFHGLWSLEDEGCIEEHNECAHNEPKLEESWNKFNTWHG